MYTFWLILIHVAEAICHKHIISKGSKTPTTEQKQADDQWHIWTVVMWALVYFMFWDLGGIKEWWILLMGVAIRLSWFPITLNLARGNVGLLHIGSDKVDVFLRKLLTRTGDKIFRVVLLVGTLVYALIEIVL